MNYKEDVQTIELVINDVECNHIIGEWIDCDYNENVTFNRLKELIRNHNLWYAWFREEHDLPTLNDYLDGNMVLRINKFNYCPMCGERIDWEKIKEE